MQEEIIQSVGIDIGTSTTQLVFSKLTVANLAGSYAAPRVQIIEKRITYRSAIYFTPLSSPVEIDAKGVEKIVRQEYQKAGVRPEDLKTGAVIITGDTARKQNANSVLESLSDLAGDFVVATAGPDLESVLSARGAGADRLSKKNRMAIANLDVGGGTSNLAVYENGTLRGTCCLDIGGRLIKIEDGRLVSLYPKIQKLAAQNGISLAVGDPADVDKLFSVCRLMAAQLALALSLETGSSGGPGRFDEAHLELYTNGGKPLSPSLSIQGITFSGGVADYVYGEDWENVYRYGDIGVLLGRAIREDPAFAAVKRYPAAETIGATVVGAGEHIMEVSGGTIRYAEGRLPVKNVPILKVPPEEETSLNQLSHWITSQLPLYVSEGEPEQVAIALTGTGRSGFTDIQELAAAILQGAAPILNSEFPFIVIVEEDIGKALGNALNAVLPNGKDVICIDGISTASGDYADIGEPLVNGRTVPVVIKTLIFNS